MYKATNVFFIMLFTGFDLDRFLHQEKAEDSNGDAAFSQMLKELPVAAPFDMLTKETIYLYVSFI
jgi:hypothetical protein